MLPLTSETLFVEIYERKRLNWQRKELAVKKMLFFTFLSMFAFVANIFGEGGWVISDSLTNPLGFGDLPKVAKIKTLASTGSPAMDAVGPDGLPLVLPGGSPQAVRDYIVAPHAWAGVHGINVGIETPMETYQATAIKSTHGYSSYSAFLDDARDGFASSIQTFITRGVGVVNPTNELNAVVSYLYFANEDPVPGVLYSRVLFIYKYLGTFGELIADPNRFLKLAVDSCQVEEPPIESLMIVGVPNLSAINMAVQLPGGMATLSWSLANPKVSVLQNWVNRREWNIPGLLYLRSWVMEGSYSARVALTKKDGTTVVYTQFGQRVVTPSLSINGSNLMVLAPRGSNVIIDQSSDLVNWTRFRTVQNIGSDGSTTLSLPLDLSRKASFFRADSN